MSRIETALSRFNSGFYCSQAVLAAFAPQLGMEEETAIKVAGAFGGGVANTGGTCGAVNGAYMVIGLKYADTDAKNYQATKKTNNVVREFIKNFETLNGSTICKDLLKCDIGTSDGFKYAIEQKLFSSVCPKFVKDSIEILEHLLK
ncbi:C-GCAxxG-C-C family protein [Pelotomaculum isophthalicicum JI]|uniref:C-GCAxxG-C-C family protein n=1 Tax=Pelotomaculum isophthalicicum JI TaxID=947010 RepID=A0A9X4H3I2_9FIRM|nr:C-GCAxxG-C-C family protein [Pelotomaculum isophthalicicum]MDF9409645.1 C-GCAxxG-C-C family protein [Pelotomaculum isophthalicicum JI]